MIVWIPGRITSTTSSRQLSLDRAGFTTLLHEAAVGDTIRRVLDAVGARNLPDPLDAPPTDSSEQHRVPALGPDATLDLPGLLADHLRTTGDETVRQALASGRTLRRGHGITHRPARASTPLADPTFGIWRAA